MDLQNIYLTNKELPTLAVIGPYNTGKSTLINNLLGQNVLPIDIVPATPAPIVLHYGERFLARVYYSDRQVTTLAQTELNALLCSKHLADREILKVEVWLKNNLLQKMHLIDTPGNDAANGPVLNPGSLTAVDYIVYLLHQRGPSESDRKNIQDLVQKYGSGRIIFLINCNLGNYDGTSYEETYQFLRQICSGEVSVYLINTMNHNAISIFRLYIEYQAAKVVLQRIAKNLDSIERKIPGTVAASMNEANDSDFLLLFWQAREYALEVLHTKKIISSLPLVSQQINKALREESPPSINSPNYVSVVYKSAGQFPDPLIMQGRFQSFIERIISDPILSVCKKSRKQLKSISRDIKQEDYLVTAAGGFSSGKTTFFNALMGEPLLPAENRPTTFTITLLKHGSPKKAVIKFAQQVRIPTHIRKDQHVIICRHELATLERWLTDSDLMQQINALHKSINGRLNKVSVSEVLQEIEKLKEYFARVKRHFPNSRRPWKSLFKKISTHSFTNNHLADYFIVDFKNTEALDLDLENNTNQDYLKRIAGSHLALRVKKIIIQHPSELLRTASFVDTPGLDSVYHRHREITAHYIPASDCFLLFLNGKHILTKPDLGIFRLISQALQNNNLESKLFIIINFADMLSPRQRERVYNYLHENIAELYANKQNSAGIYFISALDALTGRDKNSFYRLMQALKDQIWKERCADKYLTYSARLKKVLHSVLIEESPEELKTHHDSLTLFTNDANLLKQDIKSVVAKWTATISSFNDLEQFRGFQDGQQKIKCGLLKLSRKTVPVPFYQTLVQDIKNKIEPFNKRWCDKFGIEVPNINVQEILSVTNRILKSRNNLQEACSTLNSFLSKEETRIFETINTMELNMTQNMYKSSGKISHKKIADLKSVINGYTAELEEIEKTIINNSGS